jgi:gliding motility-associated lipoprotein GldB
MAMQKYLISYACLLALVLGVSCNNGKKLPDVSNIPMSVSLNRFDSALFTIDTNNVREGISHLYNKYPVFLPIYITDIMNLGAFKDSVNVPSQLRMFLTTPDFIKLEAAVQEKYKDPAAVTRQLEEAFRYTKYYIPSFRAPKVVTFISGIANYGAITIDTILGIGLDMYMGADFPPYAQIPDYPEYMVRRFDPAYIPVNAMQVIQQQLYPSAHNNGNLLEQMIEGGKQQYFLDQVLPATADTLKMGYTKEQLKWCYDNEQMIWQFFVQNNLLYTTDWQDINHFINDAPSTQGMPEGSPGKIGYFVGWQIVKKYMSGHSEITLQQLMEKKELMEIFRESKYKPK